MTRDEIREAIDFACEASAETCAALGTDLKRDGEGFIVDGSDLGIAIRELEHVVAFLSRLSFKLVTHGIEAAAAMNPGATDGQA
jgi:hypothetical protein